MNKNCLIYSAIPTLGLAQKTKTVLSGDCSLEFLSVIDGNKMNDWGLLLPCTIYEDSSSSYDGAVML